MSDYPRNCCYCGLPIIMHQTANGHWVPLDRNHGGAHGCAESGAGTSYGNISKEGVLKDDPPPRLLSPSAFADALGPKWFVRNSDWPPDHPVTFSTNCWYCGEDIFVHSNGKGDTVLFEPPLGRPWTRHDCLGMQRVAPAQLQNRLSWGFESLSIKSNLAYDIYKISKIKILSKQGTLYGWLKNSNIGINRLYCTNGKCFDIFIGFSIGMYVNTLLSVDYVIRNKSMIALKIDIPEITGHCTPFRIHEFRLFPIRALRDLNEVERSLIFSVFDINIDLDLLSTYIYGTSNTSNRKRIRQELRRLLRIRSQESIVKSSSGEELSAEIHTSNFNELLARNLKIKKILHQKESISMETFFALCINNTNHDDLEKGKVYKLIFNSSEIDQGLVRAIDESGDDYLYPKYCFFYLDLPNKVKLSLQKDTVTEA